MRSVRAELLFWAYVWNHFCTQNMSWHTLGKEMTSKKGSNNNFALTSLKFNIYTKLNYLQVRLKSKISFSILKGFSSYSDQSMLRHTLGAILRIRLQIFCLLIFCLLTIRLLIFWLLRIRLLIFCLIMILTT